MSLTSSLSNFYENVLWGGYVDNRAEDYLIINSRWILPLLIAVHLLLVLKFVPQYMKNRKPYDLRPFLIVFNGLNFGAYGCGVAVIGYAIDYGSQSWQCQVKDRNMFKEEVFLRVGYALFVIRLFEMLTSIIMILRRTPSQKPTLQAIYNAFYLLLIHQGLNRYSREVIYMYPFADGVKIALRSAYYSLQSPGRYFGDFKRFRTFVQISAILLTFVCIAHASSMIIRDCDGPKFLMFGFLTLSLSEAYFYLKWLVSKEEVTRVAKD